MAPPESSQSGPTSRRGGKTPFEMVVREGVNPPVLQLKGDVDVGVAEKLHDQLGRLVDSGHLEIVVDCQGVTYFDSTGLSELVWAVKRMHKKGHLRLVGCSPRLIKLFHDTGLDTVLDIQLHHAA